MDDQIDGAAAADALSPVDEFGAVDREGPLGGMPLVRIVGVGLRPPARSTALKGMARR